MIRKKKKGHDRPATATSRNDRVRPQLLTIHPNRRRPCQMSFDVSQLVVLLGILDRGRRPSLNGVERLVRARWT